MNKKLSIIGMLLVLVFSAGATIGLTETNYNVVPGETINGQFNFTNDLGYNLTNVTFGLALNGINGSYVTFDPANGFDGIIVGEIKAISFNLEIPQTAPAGMHSGRWFIYGNYGNENLTEANFTVNVSEKYELGLDTEVKDVDLMPENSKTFTIVVTNNGNMKLENLTISHIATNFIDEGDNQIEINFSIENGFDLDVGDVEHILVTVTTQSGQYFYPERDHDYTGLITVSNAAEVSQSFNLNIDLEMEAFNHIEITNLEDFEELVPGEEFDIEIEFDDATFDTEDIEVELTIFDLEEGKNNLDLDSEKLDIDEDDDYDLEFNLEVPLDVNDAKHDVLLYINGDSDDIDYSNFRYYVYYEDAIDVEKDEKYDAGFNYARLEPELLMCGTSFTLTTEVINTGYDRLNDMYLKLKINELDILEISGEFDLDEDEGDRDEKVEFFVNLPTGMEAKEYDIELIAYDEDGDIIGSEIITFTPYGNCVQIEEQEESSDEINEESSEGTIFMPTGWSVSNLLGNENAKTSFWVFGNLALLAIITYFLSLFFKKRK